MQIVFYTPPLVQNGRAYTYVPHLVEHAVGVQEDFSLADHFLYNIDLVHTYMVNHAIYTTGYDQHTPRYMEHICKPLTPYSIEKEKEMLRQEIAEYKPIDESLLRTIEADLYGDSFVDDEQIDISTQAVIDYHHTRYQKEYAIICTEKFELTLPTKRHDIPVDPDEHIYSKPISFGGGEGQYLYTNNTNRRSFYKMQFIRQLVSEYSRYICRYKESTDFDYPEAESFMTKDHRVLGIPDTMELDIPTEFFEAFKTHFIKIIFIEFDTSDFCYYNLIEKGLLTKEIVLGYIESFGVEILSEIERGHTSSH